MPSSTARQTSDVWRAPVPPHGEQQLPQHEEEDDPLECTGDDCRRAYLDPARQYECRFHE